MGCRDGAPTNALVVSANGNQMIGHELHRNVVKPYYAALLRNRFARKILSILSTLALFAGLVTISHACCLPILPAIFLAYCVTRCATTLMPHAHGAQCRLATIVCVASSTCVLASIPAGGLAAVILLCCPRQLLWWPKKEVAETPLRIETKDDVIQWIKANGRQWENGIAKLLKDESPTKHKHINSLRL